MTAKFVAEEGLLKGLVLPLEWEKDEGREWVMGRDPDECQLLLEDPAASRKHVLCKSTPEGIVLENLSHTNPVQVNEEELKGPRLLKEGDSIKIGSGVFRYFVERSPVAAGMKSIATDDDEGRESILEEGDVEEGKHRFPEINFEMTDTGRWLLKVIAGPNNGAEFSMQPGKTYIIGTDPQTCDIVFHDTSVSRQHARVVIADDDEMTIEDLKSRNGTLVDGESLREKVTLNPNTIVTLGTTSFVIYDREGNMQTIISPLLPSIVKVLQKGPKEDTSTTTPEVTTPIPEDLPPPHKERSIGGLLIIAIATGLLVIGAIGTTTLFKNEPVVAKEAVDTDKALADVLMPYPSIKYSFNKGTGRIVLFGHLLNAQDKTQMLYGLQSLPFVKGIDDSGVIIDEFIWQEINQVLNKNPNWRTITMQSPAPGQFVLTGSIQSSKAAAQLYDYISANFPYLDRLERKVVVEEDVISEVRNKLERAGILNATVSFKNGELFLSGGVPANKEEEYRVLLDDIKNTPGVRSIRNQISNLAPEQSMVNISDRYEVSGFSKIGRNISVVINGRIVTKGDVLDSMLITEITSGTVYLEKDQVKYRIDFSK